MTVVPATRFLEAPAQVIDGQRVPAATGRTLPVEDPATGGLIATIPASSADDVDRAVAAARASVRDGRWSRLSGIERGRILSALAGLIRDHAEELAVLETLDTGHPLTDARFDVADTAHHFEYYAGLAGKTAGEAHLLPDGNLLTIVRVPVGVVGAINPWNFPIAGAGLKAAPILAAGNSLVLKPSSLTSLSTLAVAELALEAGVPPGVFNVVTGGGAEVGGALARHPDIGLLSFTGGTETGFGVMRDRAEVGRAVQLELGGKSPTLVFDDVDLDEVVPAAAFGIYMNQGQNCSAGSRVLVHEAIHDRFVEALTELSASIRVLPPFDPQSQLGSLVSGDHLDKVHAWVERARSDGATITTGGHALSGEPYGRGHFYAPTVITDTSRADAAFREEIFGPVVVVAPFSTEAEAIEIANENRYGLAASVWTSDGRRALRVATAIDAGFVWMNTINAHPIEAPFGGVKDSGFGREEGLHALETYSVQKSMIMGGRRFDHPYAG
jgi:acyl-CoA reductase-like NAD-dependent aldehyde dehydrogenase